MNKKTKNIIIILILGSIIILTIFLLNSSNIFNYAKIPYKENSVMAIIYIGGAEEEYDYSLVNKYFETDRFEEIKLQGTEKYLIIPRNNNVDVYEMSMTEDGGTAETYITTMNKPFYITCNISDIFSNSILKISKNNKKFEYSPYISLKDGSVAQEEFVTVLTN